MSHHEQVTGLPARELVGNKAVEDAAIAFVIDHERRSGRVARDTRGRGAAADVESDDRIIEVKAAGGSARGADLWLETRQVDEARRNPNFHLYVVDNVRQGDPGVFGLVDLHGEVLNRLLERAKEQRYYAVPFPVSVYDDNREMPPAAEAPKAPSTTDSGREPNADLVAMPRTAAILFVLTSHTGPMRPIEVWTALRRLGRENDPKGDVSTTMFDLWKAGRIGKSARGQYYGLRQHQPPSAPAASRRERPEPTTTAAPPEPASEATAGRAGDWDGQLQAPISGSRPVRRRFPPWIRGKDQRGGRRGQVGGNGE